MGVYLVTYDLRAPGRDYQRLYNRLGEWKAVRALESVWLIDWRTEAKTIRDDLAQHIDDNDGLLVTRMRREWRGRRLRSGVADWLNSPDRSWD